MKIFGTDTKPILINFETSEKQYGLAFERDFLGNIKNISFSIGEKGAMYLDVKPIKVITITPKNKIDKLKKILWLIKYYLEKRFQSK